MDRIEEIRDRRDRGFETTYREVGELLAHIDTLREQLETERIRLAACGVAAMANTEETVKQRIDKDNPYYSASYGDVCSAVDREMKYRAALAEKEKIIDAAGVSELNNMQRLSTSSPSSPLKPTGTGRV